MEHRRGGRMTLNGIDVSDWQQDIDLSKVSADFVIVKMTQGVDYLSPVRTSQYISAKKTKKLLGVYHYADGSGAEAEAKYFLNNVKDYVGEAVLALDWEGEVVTKGVSYAKTWLDYVYKQTKVKPLIYMSKSVTNAYDWSIVSKDYGLWCAQYASEESTGYQEEPWTDNTVFGSWTTPTIYQYSSHGNLPGYNGSLDLNKFYGGKDDWAKLAKTGDIVPTTITPIIQYSDDNGNRAYAYTHWQAVAGKPELNILESPNGTKFELRVDNTGKLTAVKKE